MPFVLQLAGYHTSACALSVRAQVGASRRFVRWEDTCGTTEQQVVLSLKCCYGFLLVTVSWLALESLLVLKMCKCIINIFFVLLKQSGEAVWMDS